MQYLKDDLFCFFRASHLLYGVEVHANTTANHLSKWTTLNNNYYIHYSIGQLKHIIQNYIEPILLFNSSYYIISRYCYLFINMSTLEISYLRVVFSTYIEENKILHCHDTRQKNDFHMYAVQSEVGKKDY